MIDQIQTNDCSITDTQTEEKRLNMMPNNITGHKHEIQGLPNKVLRRKVFLKMVVKQSMCVNMLLNFLGVFCPPCI